MGGLELPRAFGAYELLEPLGSGGMGEVFLARPKARGGGLPPLVVIKRIHGEVSAMERGIRRFQHEAAIASLIDSPYVARVYDAGSVGEDLYIAMEYIVGWPLTRIQQALSERGEVMSLPAAMQLIHGVALGLQAIHEAKGEGGQDLKAVHRDIAPKNLMLGEDGRPRVIDLGIGKSRLQDWKTKTGALLGSPGYMAPEQVAAGSTDQRTDLYALGIVAWELVSGEPLIPLGSVPAMLHAALNPQHRPLSELRAGVPPAFDALVERLLSLRPADRPASSRAVVGALEAMLPAGEGASAVRALVDDTLLAELELTKTRVGSWALSTLGEDLLAPADLVAPPSGVIERPLAELTRGSSAAPPSLRSGSGRSSSPLLAFAGLGLLLSGLVALFAVLRESGPEVAPPIVSPPLPVVATATRAIVAHPRPAAIEPAAPERRTPLESTPPRRTKREPPRSPASAPPSPSPSPSPVAAALPVEVGSVDLLKQDVTAAYARAMSLRQRLEPSDPRRERVDRLVAGLLVLKSAPDRARLEALTRELAALER